jgi:hypothetical protein
LRQTGKPRIEKLALGGGTLLESVPGSLVRN